MAVGRFEVDTDQLRRAVSALREDLRGLRQAQEELKGMMGELSAKWEGPAKTAFHSRFDGDCLEFQALCGQLDETFAGLESAAQAYDTCDGRVRGVVDSIKV